MLVLAQEEARLLDHGFIGTEHLLLGLVHEEEGVAARALRSFGISLESAREKVQEAIGVAGTTASGSPAFTTRAKKVLELSLREALQLGHSYIGTEHLLLGLIRQGESMGVAVLESFGADPTSVRQQTISRMAGTDPDGSIRQIGVAPLVAATPEWTPPIWDRPSEGTVPAVLVVDAMVLQNDVVAVVVDRLEVYPNGFMINLLLRVDPRRVGDLMAMLGSRGPGGWPRIGVRFADGRTAGGEVGSLPNLAKDEHGVPIELFMSTGSRGGAPSGWRAWAWVFPLPPEGPLEIFVALEAAGLDESSVIVDGTTVRLTAERAQIIWT